MRSIFSIVKKIRFFMHIFVYKMTKYNYFELYIKQVVNLCINELLELIRLRRHHFYPMSSHDYTTTILSFINTKFKLKKSIELNNNTWNIILLWFFNVTRDHTKGTTKMKNAQHKAKWSNCEYLPHSFERRNF